MKLEAAIELPNVAGRIDHLALEGDGKRIAIACLQNDTVAVVDLDAKKIAGTIPHLEKPQGIAVVPPAGRIVVANGEDYTVRWFDAKTLEVARTVELEGDADNVRWDAASSLLYVGYGDGGIAAIGASGVERKLPLEGHPESFQLEVKGKRIFANVPDAKHVAVLDRETGKTLAKWPTGDALDNYPMALDEAGKRLFVGCRTPARLLVYDSEAGKIVAKLEISGDVDDVFLDETRSRLFAICGEGRVDVLDRTGADVWTRTARVETRAGARTGLYDAVTKRLFVAVPARDKASAELRVYSVH